jgi:histidine triad (HIT) family protein
MESARGPVWKNLDWFCHGILDGALAGERVYETDEVVAFRAPKGHRNKKYDQHLIVIPKRHVETLLDLGPADASLANSLLEAIQAAASACGLDQSGFFVRANVLPPYQGTGHLHIHLLSGRREKKAKGQVL